MVAKRTGLARARKAAAYTQESLAEALHVDVTTVGNWEQGRTEPLPYKRPKLAKLLGITAAELEQLLRPDSDSRISASAKSDPAPDSSTTGGSALHATRSIPSLMTSGSVSQPTAPTHVPAQGDEPKFLMPIDPRPYCQLVRVQPQLVSRLREMVPAVPPRKGSRLSNNCG